MTNLNVSNPPILPSRLHDDASRRIVGHLADLGDDRHALIRQGPRQRGRVLRRHGEQQPAGGLRVGQDEPLRGRRAPRRTT